MKRSRKSWIISAIVIVLVLIYLIRVFTLPFPTLTSSTVQIASPKTNLDTIAWPQDSQEALGAENYGVLITHGEQTSKPIGSIAKLVLALSIIQQKPLSIGQQGPSINITQADLDLYTKYLAQNGSVVPVRVGEQLSEYQALQELLLPSGDNIADTLANWGFGSVNNYLTYTNQQINAWGLKQTHVADSSGLSPETVSNAGDLVNLGDLVLKQPVLAEIVSQAQATLPVIGLTYNYNSLLGSNNVVGIKTGNTTQAGGCFLFAQNRKVNSQNVTMIGAIMGATDLASVLQDAQTFLQTNTDILQLATITTSGQNVGTYNLPWGKQINVVAAKNLSALLVSDQQISVNINLQTINKHLSQGTQVGTITAENGASDIIVPAVLASAIPQPTFFWKLTHPF
jgi:D-alanyl-D-alanine carboxypeptidase (penicillin-binding protein 5/6)